MVKLYLEPEPKAPICHVGKEQINKWCRTQDSDRGVMMKSVDAENEEYRELAKSTELAEEFDEIESRSRNLAKKKY